MKRKPKRRKPGFPVYAVYWTDATKADDMTSDAPLTPAHGLSLGCVPSKGALHLTMVREVFDDGDMRDAVSIPAGMIKKIVRVGYAPSIEEVFKHGNS